jgi:hypothetical protein
MLSSKIWKTQKSKKKEMVWKRRIRTRINNLSSNSINNLNRSLWTLLQNLKFEYLRNLLFYSNWFRSLFFLNSIIVQLGDHPQEIVDNWELYQFYHNKDKAIYHRKDLLYEIDLVEYKTKNIVLEFCAWVFWRISKCSLNFTEILFSKIMKNFCLRQI